VNDDLYRHDYVCHPGGEVSTPSARLRRKVWWVDDIGPKACRLIHSIANRFCCPVEYESDIAERFYVRSRKPYRFEFFVYYRRLPHNALWVPQFRPYETILASAIVTELLTFANSEGFDWFYLQGFGEDPVITQIARTCGLLRGGEHGSYGQPDGSAFNLYRRLSHDGLTAAFEGRVPLAW